MQIPKDLEEFMDMISSESGLDEFILFGGNVIDFFLGKSFNYGDVDILIKAKTDSEKNNILNILKREGFSLSEERAYFICRSEKVYLFQATKGNILLDITICPSIKEIPGPFNAQSVYCIYPEMIYVDKDDSLKAIRDKKFICKRKRGFCNENPYILLGRFLLLCSKYSASILLTKEHRQFIKDFNSRKKLNNLKDFNLENKSSLLSKILKSIAGSRNKKKFIREILDSKILINIFDELEESLRIIYKTSNIEEIRDKKDLIREILKNCPEKNKGNIKKQLETLNKREWDKEDKFII